MNNTVRYADWASTTRGQLERGEWPMSRGERPLEHARDAKCVKCGAAYRTNNSIDGECIKCCHVSIEGEG